MEKLRVGVLMGGKSIEREVSFNSGRTICDHLDTSRYHIVPLFQTDLGTLFILPWHFLHRGKISDFQSRLEAEAEKLNWDNLPSLIDFMYIAMHGHYAEDGIIQGVLEVLGIPYLGSGILASALGMDKIKQKQILHAAGIAVPRGIVVSVDAIEQLDTQCAAIFAELAHNNIYPPYLVKPSAEGSSLGVCVIFDNDHLPGALHIASTINPHKKQPVVIEEKIEGMEFSCVILTDYKTGMPMPLPPTEIMPHSETHIFDYDQKYMPGYAQEYTPARTTSENIKLIQDTCIATMRTLNFTNLARIDGFLTTNNNVVIIDPNSLSGMAPATFLFRQAAEINMSHTHVINHLIETELEQYGMLQPLLRQEKKENHHMNTKLHVGVLCGGRSNEKEISLESGRNICYKLSPQKYDVTPLFVNHALQVYAINQRLLVRNSTQEIEMLLEPSMRITWHELATRFDFIFIGLHGGQGENGSVQGMLEMIGIPYNGSGVLTSALCMDKYKTNQFLKTHGFDVPASYLIHKDEWHNNRAAVKEKIAALFPSQPLIIKPHDDGCSVMVQKISSHQHLDESINNLFSQEKQYALVEEYITGMELTVGVVGNETPRALPPSQAIATAEILSIKEKFLPGAGENQTPAPLEPEELIFVQKTVEQVYKTVNAKGYARIDCFYQHATESPTGKARVIIIEINTLPGLTPATCIFHQAAEINMKPMDFIDHIVQLGLEEHNTVHLKNLTKEMALTPQ